VILAWLPLPLLAEPVSVQAQLGRQAQALLADLAVTTEVVTQWPSDDELWLHHDGSHVLAMEFDASQVSDWPMLLSTLDREFRYYALYRLSKPYYVLLMSRAVVIPWPNQLGWAARFVADQQVLQHVFALHQVTLKHLVVDQIGKTMPLHLLYPRIRSSRWSSWQPPEVGRNGPWQRLNLAVSLANPTFMLSASTHLLGSMWSHYSTVHQQYALGMAMMANAMLQQYALALLLWDKYAPSVYQHRAPSLDMVLLRNYCLHASLRAELLKSALKHK
jgi:hypothetical protein